ncbi:MAG: MFS transporter [Crinalium sp.]
MSGLQAPSREGVKTSNSTDRSIEHLPFLLQPASHKVWVQAIARSLYQAGYGSIQFFIPLIFVNQVGLSATSVGIGIGSGSLAGIVGHFLGGYLADSPAYGRKRALLFSAGLSILAMISISADSEFANANHR